MSKRKNNLDEMQEQKLLRIEHNGVWFAFWGLAVAILIQGLNSGANEFRNIIGELVVFLGLDLYLLVACIKNGIWDRKLRANTKTNIIASLLAGVVIGLLYFISSYLRYHKLLGSIATGIVMLSMTAILTFIVLSICASIYKKRLKKLEEDSDLDSDDIKKNSSVN